MREAPSITIINSLVEHGAKINAYDPQAIETAKEIFKESIEYANSSYSALEGAYALILLKEWNEFRHPDFERIKSNLKDKVIFDGRNQYNHNKLASLGINYVCIGN